MQKIETSNKSLYEVQAYNDAANTANGMHRDEIARRHGFEGALVPGATLFGHMSYLPVRDEGTAWMTNNRIEVRFIAPAYDGEVLTIEHERRSAGGETLCLAVTKKVLARMQHTHATGFEPADTLKTAQASPSNERIDLQRESLTIGAPLASGHFVTDASANRDAASRIEDDLDLYREEEPPIHPLVLLQECNSAFARACLVPVWIHVGSNITWHEPILTGERVDVRIVPTANWDKRGHRFATFYIAFLVGENLRAEVDHTLIYRVGAGSP